MKTMILKLATVAFIFGVANSSFAADKTKMYKTEKEWTTLTPEQRSKMATLHENMATCLRGTKPMDECKDEMMTSCKSSMGTDECPMMMKHMHSMEHHDMMKKSKSNE